MVERRPITPGERRNLHAKGRRLMQRVWLTAAVVSTVIAVSSELYAHGFIEVPEALAIVIIAILLGTADFSTTWPLGRRLLRVSGRDEVLDCQPGGPLIGMDRHQRVVAPTGLVIQRDHQTLKVPKVVAVRSVAIIPADVLADIERKIAEGALEGTRMLEGDERREAGRDRDLYEIAPWILFAVGATLLTVALVEHGFRWVGPVSRSASFTVLALAFARSSALIRKRSPAQARFLVNVSIDGHVVRWAEYVDRRLWTVEGRPAPWRIE